MFTFSRPTEACSTMTCRLASGRQRNGIQTGKWVLLTIPTRIIESGHVCVRRGPGHRLTEVAEIKETLSAPCASCEEIDDALRSYLAAATAAKGLLVNRFPARLTTEADHLHPEEYIAHCVLELCASSIFTAHGDYVRRQFVYVLLQVSQRLCHMAIGLTADRRKTRTCCTSSPHS
jgi:hypothetical protein